MNVRQNLLVKRLAPQLTVLACAALAAIMLPAQAQNLADLYQDARQYDAGYQSALSAANATLARGEQAKAGVWPTAGFQAGASRSWIDSSFTASQPLYRPVNKLNFEQGEKQANIAKAQLLVAEQDLIIRTSQAYFDVLAALDTLAFVLAQKAAVSEQLASAKRNFEVGTSTITDTREAQARFDLVTAQEIAAENDVRVKKMALNQLVGKSNVEPKPLVIPLTLPSLAPNDVNQWVAATETSHPNISQARLALEVAQLETAKAEAGNKPTLDLNASFGTNRNQGSAANTANTSSTTGNIALAFNWPIFTGFAVQNRIKETLALEDEV
jgi:outer membrane protein